MYEFTEDCMIHIEQIDNEHRKLFQMLNEAFTMVQETGRCFCHYHKSSFQFKELCNDSFCP